MISGPRRRRAGARRGPEISPKSLKPEDYERQAFTSADYEDKTAMTLEQPDPQPVPPEPKPDPEDDDDDDEEDASA